MDVLLMRSAVIRMVLSKGYAWDTFEDDRFDGMVTHVVIAISIDQATS